MRLKATMKFLLSISNENPNLPNTTAGLSLSTVCCFLFGGDDGAVLCNDTLESNEM